MLSYTFINSHFQVSNLGPKNLLLLNILATHKILVLLASGSSEGSEEPAVYSVLPHTVKPV